MPVRAVPPSCTPLTPGLPLFTWKVVDSSAVESPPTHTSKVEASSTQSRRRVPVAQLGPPKRELDRARLARL